MLNIICMGIVLDHNQLCAMLIEVTLVSAQEAIWSIRDQKGFVLQSSLIPVLSL